MSNFISLVEAKKLKLELLPLGPYEKYIMCDIGGRKYKAEAKVLLCVGKEKSRCVSDQLFFVVRSNDSSLLLSIQGLLNITDECAGNYKAVTDIGYCFPATAPPSYFASVSALRVEQRGRLSRAATIHE